MSTYMDDQPPDYSAQAPVPPPPGAAPAGAVGHNPAQHYGGPAGAVHQGSKGPPAGAYPAPYAAGSYQGGAQAGAFQGGAPAGAFQGGAPAGAFQGGAPAGAYPPASYGQPVPQGYPTAQHGYAPIPGNTVVVSQQPSVIIVGGCPSCRVGVLEDDFTCLGVCCAILFFPIGIVCCLALKERRCPNCGATFS